MEERKYYSVDRLEDGLAVLLSDEDESLTLSMEEVGDCAPAGGEEEPDAEAPAEGEAPAPEEDDLAAPADNAGPAPLPDAGIAGKRALKEGDILVRVNGRWQRDDAEAARRRKKNAALLASLRRRNALK